MGMGVAAAVGLLQWLQVLPALGSLLWSIPTTVWCADAHIMAVPWYIPLLCIPAANPCLMLMIEQLQG